MRIVTDPFVDFFTLTFSRFLFPFFYKTSRFFLSSILNLTAYFSGNSAPPSAVPPQSYDITSWMVRDTHNSRLHVLTSRSGVEEVRTDRRSIAVVAFVTTTTANPLCTENK